MSIANKILMQSWGFMSLLMANVASGLTSQYILLSPEDIFSNLLPQYREQSNSVYRLLSAGLSIHLEPRCISKLGYFKIIHQCSCYRSLSDV